MWVIITIVVFIAIGVIAGYVLSEIGSLNSDGERSRLYGGLSYYYAEENKLVIGLRKH